MVLCKKKRFVDDLACRLVGTSYTFPRDSNEVRFVMEAFEGQNPPIMIMRNKCVEAFFTKPIPPSSHPRSAANYSTWTLRHPSAAVAAWVAPSIHLNHTVCK